jgi:HlyD family secretion protein
MNTNPVARNSSKIQHKKNAFILATQVTACVFICLLILLTSCSGDSATTDVEPIEATGLIEGEEITIASEVGGAIAETGVQEGDLVHAGDVLVRLDDTLLQAQLAEAQAQVKTAQAERDRVAVGPRPGEIAAARAAVASAQATRDGALQAWHNAITARDNPQELEGRIVALRAELEVAGYQEEQTRLELQAAELKRDQTQEGSDARRAQEAQVRAAQAKLDAAQAAHDGAQAQLYQLYAIRNNPLLAEAQVHAAGDRYSIAAAELRLAQAQLAELEAGPSDAEIAVAEASVRQAQAAAGILAAQQNLLSLVAPNDGLVSGKIAHQGEVVLAGAPLLTIARLNPLQLTLYIPANQIGRVKLGQPVEVQVDSFPAQVFRGEVIYISPRAEFTPRSVQTQEERVNVVFAVRVHLPNDDGLLKPGMPADAVVQTQ